MIYQKYTFLFLSFFALVSCSACPSNSIALHTWTAQEQKHAAKEVQALPDDSILIPMLEDYVKLRRQAQ